MDNLNILARTLAERLMGIHTFVMTDTDRFILISERKNVCFQCGYHVSDVRHQSAEAVIREAIEKTRQQTLEQLPCIRDHHNCAEDCCIVAIRSLKQSNSGMEVRK